LYFHFFSYPENIVKTQVAQDLGFLSRRGVERILRGEETLQDVLERRQRRLQVRQQHCCRSKCVSKNRANASATWPSLEMRAAIDAFFKALEPCFSRHSASRDIAPHEATPNLKIFYRRRATQFHRYV
jgi:hypothetical protein